LEIEHLKINRNSALIWLPKIEALDLPTPKTIIVLYDHNKFVAFLEGEEGPEIFDPIVEKVKKACEEIGYPCFIRTDLASAKHDGPDSYLANNNGTIKRILGRTVEDNEIKFWPTGQSPIAFLVRKFLYLNAPFKAFHDLPIAREWRLFANPEKVICFHPYWPKEAIKFYGKEPRYWEKQLADLHMKPSKFKDLESMAIQAARTCGGEWSVDFAMDILGKWWLIDMAIKQDSWHWPGCPNGN
jgi:hypothetical protein